MAGIYIHIPFCKQACSYCDFHFSTNVSRKADVLEALQLEIKKRANYLQENKVDTIYFGGGTPSLLSNNELLEIFEGLNKQFNLSADAEITLEANPDDLSKEKLLALKASPINRLSIGVQSFFDEDLRFMNRAHLAEEAFDAIKKAQDIGFENLNVDLIFGGHTTSNKMWEQNLNHFFELNVPHLSAYSLTIEEKTLLANKIQKGKLSPVDDTKNYEQYLMLQQAVKERGFEQYELSNYCKDGQISRHNTAYWFGKKYLGLGPSAHSFNGTSRQWNLRNNARYVNAIKTGKDYYEKEELSEIDQYHEYLITSLRTKWGIDLKEIEKRFSKHIQEHFIAKRAKLNAGTIENNGNQLKIKAALLFQSDEVVRELMID